MSTVSNSRSEFWTTHFVDLAETDTARNKQLDFSNHALVVQNYAYILEACGAIAGKRVLDAGFGNGDLSKTLDLLGGKVSAFDVVPTRIPGLRESTPNVAWWQDDLSTWTLPPTSEHFDLIVAAESLQYVDFDDALLRLVAALGPGGRLVLLIPNADCPIVKRTSARFDHQYVGVSMEDLPQRFSRLLHTDKPIPSQPWAVAYRGIYFQEDQSIVPYRSGSWRVLGASQSNGLLQGPHAKPYDQRVVANRLQIVISSQDSNST